MDGKLEKRYAMAITQKDMILARIGLAILTENNGITDTVWMPNSNETVMEAIVAELGIQCDDYGDELKRILMEMVATGY